MDNTFWTDRSTEYWQAMNEWTKANEWSMTHPHETKKNLISFLLKRIREKRIINQVFTSALFITSDSLSLTLNHCPLTTSNYSRFYRWSQSGWANDIVALSKTNSPIFCVSLAEILSQKYKELHDYVMWDVEFFPKTHRSRTVRKVVHRNCLFKCASLTWKHFPCCGMAHVFSSLYLSRIEWSKKQRNKNSRGDTSIRKELFVMIRPWLYQDSIFIQGGCGGNTGVDRRHFEKTRRRTTIGRFFTRT